MTVIRVSLRALQLNIFEQLRNIMKD